MSYTMVRMNPSTLSERQATATSAGQAFAAGARALGLAAVASALSESIQAVSNWTVRGVPANRCKAVEALIDVSVRDLRPNDWRDYWPELAGHPDAAVTTKGARHAA